MFTCLYRRISLIYEPIWFSFTSSFSYVQKGLWLFQWRVPCTTIPREIAKKTAWWINFFKQLILTQIDTTFFMPLKASRGHSIKKLSIVPGSSQVCWRREWWELLWRLMMGGCHTHTHQWKNNWYWRLHLCSPETKKQH